ncbi:hypothetical protein B484DRAFT_460021 [Ochromonadaceae sp. CCMP2298]|nr:hypothetical protein B484DRAFT_460021 [Ochromonadaceae sp. CCMP2298]|mmetsp:Transcript_18043/g.40736  ORF Transcript_18043/g.40736 Transcript_18043/m.40736 type:complete len:271 (+) Transcript_18043:121-933(+)|eukprot:CAMPEP_0173215666 /NCGR_PEP_ID=MMETSP1141-20130122/26618_1 /TAXON_ID=483371 /ORGANISM="non described non described, Strain CCMP2298" /LENGTH=270 /DNA_ID=CAMNT_0014143093 /DNA_START=20 /DNA_END=832 /DNA_ORIENTATION=-
MDYPILSSVFARAQDSIFSMLSLHDVLNLAQCSKFSHGLGISGAAVTDLLERSKRNTHIGHLRLNFSNELTTGLLSKVLYQLNVGTDAMIYVDSTSGRIMMELGSGGAATETTAEVVENVEILTDDDSFDRGTIFKHLEDFSVDEYDDFNPRHPKLRDRAHRRGDSYFNSDIDMVVNELHSGMRGDTPFNMSAMGAALGEDGAGTGGVAAGAWDKPLPPAGTLKSRLMQRKKEQAGHVMPPRASSPKAVTRLPYQMRASAELEVESEEDK